MASRRVESFLLRLVVDEVQAADLEPWRGRIQHVSSGSEQQFEHMHDMLAFINQQLESRQSFFISFDSAAAAE